LENLIIFLKNYGNEKKKLKRDLEFLEEMKQYAIKWDEKRDTPSRDMLFCMIGDWINEINEKLEQR
jgi:hypothetical protein